MKLFVWRPDGFGQKNIAVMAETQEQAQEKADVTALNGDRYDFQGWGTDYYKLEIYEAGQVVVFDND